MVISLNEAGARTISRPSAAGPIPMVSSRWEARIQKASFYRMASLRRRPGDPMLQKEAQHLARRIRSTRIGVGTRRATS